MTPAKRYPSGEVTPAGWHNIVNGVRPMMWLDAYDGSIRFDLLGGLAPPFNDPMQPEAVALTSLKGLIPPWRHIDQKGATEDGVTQVDALLDPIEVEMSVECIGRDAVHANIVHRDLIASIDAKQESTLNWFTPEMGYWWAPIRWFKGGQSESLAKLQHPRQRHVLRLRADRAVWIGPDDTSMFEFLYEDFTDTFDYDTETVGNLGPNWPLHYDGPGGGFIYADGSQARWKDDPDDWLTTQTRRVVFGPYKDFETATDNQVVSMVMGSLQEWSLPEGASNGCVARMDRDVNGDWLGNGVGFTIENHWLNLVRYNNFVETVMARRFVFIPPLWGEKFTLVCGYEDDPRMFRVMRNGIPVLSHKESGTGSLLGANYRGVGGSMQASGAVITQATPASIRKISAGDNAAVAQKGFLNLRNVGDQPCYYDYTLFGPFTKVKIYDGPSSPDYVEFGPLLDHQVVFLRTDLRSNTTLVTDLTSVPPTPQHLGLFQQAIKAFESFAFANNVPPLFRQIESLFGIVPPQGNLYKYLKGRFSNNSAIPAKSPGNPTQPYHVKVEIEGGNADSKILAAGTPMRRYPI